jgi:hypothetical protein
VPRSLVNRGTALLLDFIGVAGGRRNLEEFYSADVNALIHEVVEAWHGGPERDASVIDDADDYEKYLAALILRIGHRPEANRPDLVFTPAEDLPFIRLAAGRLPMRSWIFSAGSADACCPVLSCPRLPSGKAAGSTFIARAGTIHRFPLTKRCGSGRLTGVLPLRYATARAVRRIRPGAGGRGNAGRRLTGVSG